MRQTCGPKTKPSAEAALRDVRRATRRQFSAEEKIRMVLEGLRGEDSVAELCRREGIATDVTPISHPAGTGILWSSGAMLGSFTGRGEELRFQLRADREPLFTRLDWAGVSQTRE